MAWYNADWPYRVPISVNSSGSTAPNDVTIAIPPELQHFWDNTDANDDGRDVRITDADGETLLTFDLASFDTATQTATIEIDNWSHTDNQHSLCWLYYGATGKSTGVTAFAPAAPITGYIAPERPEGVVLVLGPQRPGSTSAIQKVAKDSSETLLVYIKVDVDLAPLAQHPYQNATVYEEVDSVDFAVTSAGAPTALIDETLVRVLDVSSNGRVLWVRVAVTSGASGTNYMGELSITTTLGRIIRRVFEVQVADAVES